MFDNLLEKLEYEYQKWSNFILVTNSADYMTRAWEISVKRALYKKIKELYKKSRLNDEQIRVIMQRNDFIDFMFLRCKEEDCIILRNDSISDEDFNYMLRITIV